MLTAKAHSPAPVQFLVGELRSHKTCGKNKTKQKTKNKKTKTKQKKTKDKKKKEKMAKYLKAALQRYSGVIWVI